MISTLKKILRAALLFLAVCLLGAVDAAPEKKVVDGVTYYILHAPADAVMVVWKDGGGRQLRTFPAVTGYLEGRDTPVATLMNGGIFEPGGVPSGLLVQAGKQLRPVNRDKGKGNFFLEPNGIFLIGSRGASVIRTDEYPPQNTVIEYAVQSGPLLLRGGEIHPVFRAKSDSRLHRNGVGVSKDGQVVLAISDLRSAKFPNLYDFAELFRSLGCEDALFLDGDISQMRSGSEITKRSNRFGAVIAVIESGNKGAFSK